MMDIYDWTLGPMGPGWAIGNLLVIVLGGLCLATRAREPGKLRWPTLLLGILNTALGIINGYLILRYGRDFLYLLVLATSQTLLGVMSLLVGIVPSRSGRIDDHT